MAVANFKSTIITNAESLPRKPNNKTLERGVEHTSRCLISVAAADDDGSIYRGLYIPSSALVTDILVANSAITAGTAYDLGLWKKKASAADDDDLLLSAVDMSSARAQLTSLLLETTAITNAEKTLWELRGLTTDPFIDYEVNFTADTVGSAAGTILLVMKWVVP